MSIVKDNNIGTPTDSRLSGQTIPRFDALQINSKLKSSLFREVRTCSFSLISQLEIKNIYTCFSAKN